MELFVKLFVLVLSHVVEEEIVLLVELVIVILVGWVLLVKLLFVLLNVKVVHVLRPMFALATLDSMEPFVIHFVIQRPHATAAEFVIQTTEVVFVIVNGEVRTVILLFVILLVKMVEFV